MTDNVIHLPLTERDFQHDWNAIAECRGCGKLIKVQAAMYGDGECEVMSTGGPVFGECPIGGEYPPCADKIAARVFVVEPRSPDERGYFNCERIPEPDWLRDA